MNRRKVLETVAVLPLLMLVPAQANADHSRFCDCCGQPSDALVAVMVRSFDDSDPYDSYCDPCYSAHQENKARNTFCHGCGVAKWPVPEGDSNFWSSGKYEHCEPCNKAYTKKIFDDATCHVCEAKPVVVFFDGKPECEVHRHNNSRLVAQA